MNEFSIFGDGDNLIIFSKDGKAEFAYTFESPAIMEIRLDQNNDIGELMPTMGKKRIWIPKPVPNTKFTIRGMSLAENTTIQKIKDIQ